MWHRVRDLSRDQRLAVEQLLGRALQEDEGLNIQPSRMLKDSPVGEQRAEAYRQYLGDLDKLAERAKDLPEDVLEELIDEACERVRHPGS